jgi:hypothetical protein
MALAPYCGASRTTRSDYRLGGFATTALSLSTKANLSPERIEEFVIVAQTDSSLRSPKESFGQNDKSDC